MDINDGGLFTVNPTVVLLHLVPRPPCLLITTLLEYNEWRFDSSATDDVVMQNDHPVVPAIMIHNNNKGDPISMVLLATNVPLLLIYFRISPIM